MVRRTFLLCDFEATGCDRPATTWKIWRDGERQAWSVDLCETHSEPLLPLLEKAERTDLPVKPRVKLEPTTLRTTDKTRRLKK